MNKQELIERIEDFPCEASLVTEMIRINKNTLLGWVKELDEPQPIKLKNVIKRIKGFETETQKVWIDAILNELGSGYGSKKYRDGYEQGRFEGEWVGQQLKDSDKVRQELNKPVVPQFVADWITKAKTEGLKRKNSLGSYEELFPSDSAYSAMFSIFIKGFAIGEVRNWVAENTDTFALAWINGYTVEKEKRYLVKIKGIRTVNGCLKCDVDDANWFFSGPVECAPYRANHTRKELEEAGFGEVFDSPLFEVEEVEE